MKKRNILNLIRCYAEKNDAGFRSEAMEIAKDFDANGDPQLAQYVMSLLSGNHLFEPQGDRRDGATASETFFDRVPLTVSEPLPLPDTVAEDMEGIINVVNRHRGLNKFLFEGAPGTGKTEAARQLARVLNRELFSVDFARVIDSKLGQTQKNVSSLFREMSSSPEAYRRIYLLDEIDALALDRTNDQDLREMGRVTSTMLKELDALPAEVLVVATTNLFAHMDAALVRRFDAVVNFDRYTDKDLTDIAELLLNFYLKKYGCDGRKTTLFRKILKIKKLPMPAEIKNRIRLATAFSSSTDEFSYMPRLYKAFVGEIPADLKELRAQGFTLREIEILTGVSKSSASRELKNA